MIMDSLLRQMVLKILISRIFSKILNVAIVFSGTEGDVLLTSFQVCDSWKRFWETYTYSVKGPNPHTAHSSGRRGPVQPKIPLPPLAPRPPTVTPPRSTFLLLRLAAINMTHICSNFACLRGLEFISGKLLLFRTSTLCYEL